MPTSDRPRPRTSQSSDALEVPARIVIADDDRIVRELLASMLRDAGHLVDACADGQEALDRVAQGGVDLVLLDIVMPRLSGLEACRLLKGITADGFLPVILVTVRTDGASRVEGLRIGADDYVCKPFEEAELLARVAAMLRIKRLHDHVVTQRARFERLSIHDELTGLYNYRYLHTRLGEEFKRAERYHEPFACMVVDIDHLRAVNEAAGRVAGDAAIRAVSESIKRCVREVDVVARYGGEEFLVVLPSTHFAGSVTVAERIWREVAIEIAASRSAAARWASAVQAAPTEPPTETGDARSGERQKPSAAAAEAPRPPPDPLASAPPFTVSIGVALYPSRDVRSKDALLRAADLALTQAKREGGDRICVFQQQGYIYTPAVGRLDAGVAAVDPPVGRASDSWRPPALPPVTVGPRSFERASPGLPVAPAAPAARAFEALETPDAARKGV